MTTSLFKDRFGNSKLPQFMNVWFIVGLCLKVGFGAIFASEYLRELFSPFIEYFLKEGNDPYAYFNQNGGGNEFPYPPLMLIILALGRSLTIPIGSLDPTTFGLADALGLRIPILAADFILYLVLCRWFRNKQKEVLYFYWLSPIAFYINYMHGQLDVVPMAFLLVSFHYLFKQRLNASAIFFAMSLLCKGHIILVLPLYAWFAWKNSKDGGWVNLLFPGALLALITIIGQMPFFGTDYIAMVYRNRVQNQIFDLFYQFNDKLQFLFIPAIYTVLVGWYLTLRFVNKDQLLLFVGFIFMTLTLMIEPMQGWYYWILPFMIFFVLRHGSIIESRLFFILTFFYFLFFAIAPNSDFGRLIDPNGTTLFRILYSAGFPSEKLWYITFTLMQTVLVVFAWMLYRNGIRSNIQMKFLSQPYLLGISGDSGSGKTTLSDGIVELFGESNTGVVKGDDMHKWERGDSKWTQLTHLNPEANRLHENFHHTIQLKNGRRIRRSHYDHSTGKFTLPKFIVPKKLIIFEGLHSFFLQNQADIYDLKIFMAPDESLRRSWKVQRDVNIRGYSEAKVRSQLDERREDSAKFILTQASNADVLFEFYAVIEDSELWDNGAIGLKITLANDFFIDPILDELSKYVSIRQEYIGQSREIRIEGEVGHDELERIGLAMIPELEEVGIYSPKWRDNYKGITQIIVAYIIFDKLKQS